MVVYYEQGVVKDGLWTADSGRLVVLVDDGSRNDCRGGRHGGDPPIGHGGVYHRIWLDYHDRLGG